MPKESFVNLDGLKLQYLDWEGVGKPMVLLTGLGATARYYGNLAPKLTTQFKVMGLTRRGHGHSDRPKSGYDLENFVEDIRGFLDAVGIERAVLVGHSLAGYEIPLFAKRYPQRVEAIVLLDAIYTKSETDLSGDPVDALSQIEPTIDDFASLDNYLALCKRYSPSWASIWCDAIEMDILENIKIHDDGHVEEITDFELFGQIWKGIETQYPDYKSIQCPVMAIVPLGDYHPSVPLGASDELRNNANKYWKEKYLASVQEKTKIFLQTMPHSRVVELDSPNHRIFMSKENETVQSIFEFLSN